ncbi:SymE family type I addiction module toxin [Serratia marcescens]|uniref:SymE family type I addiction module toxin n=1 Tax=Serratia marcescens TaxID=615 RepID=UPI0034D48BCB
MAAQHHKSGTITPTTKSRRYTVGYIRDQRKFKPSPSITLKGHWMADFGFETGQKIDVLTEPGQLIIRLANEG